VLKNHDRMKSKNFVLRWFEATFTAGLKAMSEPRPRSAKQVMPGPLAKSRVRFALHHRAKGFSRLKMSAT
jgi:hypothetical protein